MSQACKRTVNELIGEQVLLCLRSRFLTNGTSSTAVIMSRTDTLGILYMLHRNAAEKHRDGSTES